MEHLIYSGYIHADSANPEHSHTKSSHPSQLQ